MPPEPTRETVPETVIAGGIPVRRLNASQWCDLLVADVAARKAGTLDRPRVVTTANGQVISLFASNPAFNSAVLAADHVAADGMSVVNATRKFTSTPLPERVATTDWFHDAALTAATHGFTFYMLGSTAEVNRAAVKKINELYPDLKIVGSRDGYFGDEDLEAIAQDIDNSGADVLWLGIGNPRQLLVAHKLKNRLKTVTWIRTCGGLYDHLAMIHPRAPALLQKVGLEWAWRVAMEPRRLFWRYFTTNIHAMWRLRFHSRTVHTV